MSDNRRGTQDISDLSLRSKPQPVGLTTMGLYSIETDTLSTLISACPLAPSDCLPYTNVLVPGG